MTMAWGQGPDLPYRCAWCQAGHCWWWHDRVLPGLPSCQTWSRQPRMNYFIRLPWCQTWSRQPVMSYFIRLSWCQNWSGQHQNYGFIRSALHKCHTSYYYKEGTPTPLKPSHSSCLPVAWKTQPYRISRLWPCSDSTRVSFLIVFPLYICTGWQQEEPQWELAE